MNTNEILERLGIKELSDMQRMVSDTMLRSRNDIVVLSPTGSGKTLAYLLPLVNMLNSESDNVQAIVLVPGRELAIQSQDVFERMKCGLRSMCLYGGRAAMDEHRTLRKVRPQVLFVTPGRLNDHLDKGNVMPYGIRFLIIDEFDKCLKMGFQDEMRTIVKRLTGVQKRVLLSATDADDIPEFVSKGRIERLDFLTSEQVPDGIRQFVVKSPSKDKLETLARLLCELGDASSMVFLNYRDSVERVGEYLSSKGFVISSYHGGKDQRQREEAIYKFANGAANVLVGTDLASRGLDIPNVDNIIHYHLPQGEEEFVHRVGRTGRWYSAGKAFFVLGPEETLPDYVDAEIDEYALAAAFGKPALPKMVTLYIGKGKKDKISKGDVLGFLCKTCGLNGDDIGRIDVKERCSYVSVSRERHKEVLQRAAGEKLKGIKTKVEVVKYQE